MYVNETETSPSVQGRSGGVRMERRVMIRNMKFRLSNGVPLGDYKFSSYDCRGIPTYPISNLWVLTSALFKGGGYSKLWKNKYNKNNVHTYPTSRVGNYCLEGEGGTLPICCLQTANWSFDITVCWKKKKSDMKSPFIITSTQRFPHYPQTIHTHQL